MSGQVQIHRHAQEQVWADAACSAIAHALSAAGARRLLLSGGSTPAPVYRQLAGMDLDWERLQLGLADERWLPDGDAQRNDLLVTQQLLQQQPLARLQPLARFKDGLDACVATANAHWQAHPATSVAVLGMGNDGHTASLFPAAGNLQAAIDSPLPYAAIDAGGCPGAQTFPLRISLTPAGLAACQARILLLRGQDKLDTLQAAMASGDAQRYPILHALHPQQALQVLCCA